MDGRSPLCLLSSLSIRRCAISRSSFSPLLPVKRLHGSSAKPATPLAHPATPGPPPEPPTSQRADRLARKQRQAELLQRGQNLRANPAKPAAALQKRFWKNVSVKETPEGLQILLDARPVRTSSKAVLTIPPRKPQLATAIALEWDLLVSAQQALRQHYIPLTSLVNRAIDFEAADSQGSSKVRDDATRLLLQYLATDTLLCWAPEANPHESFGVNMREEGHGTLRQLQMRTAQPIIDYLAAKVWPGAEILPALDADSILPAPQPQTTTDIIREWLSGLPAWELAGLERAVIASKSLLVATRLLVEWSQEFSGLRDSTGAEQRFGIEDAAEACSLEVRWQTGMWGEVEDTHDVDREDIRRQLGSVILLVSGLPS